jgi:hypothetical protein
MQFLVYGPSREDPRGGCDMGVKYARCSPEDCCKDERYGAASDGSESKGRLLTKDSRDECGKGKTSAGSSCACRWVKHYSKYIKDGDGKGKNDTGWVVTNETVHEGKDKNRWSDQDEAELQAENKKMDSTKEKVQILRACLALDSDDKAIATQIDD